MNAWLELARWYHQNGTLAENSLFRHRKDSKEAVGALKEKKMTQGYGSLLWCNVVMTFARAKAIHLYHQNNNNNNNNNNKNI